MKPSIEQYEDFGKELSFLCARLSALSCQIGQQIGVSKESYKHAREAARSLDKCKSVTEDLMFSQYPGLPREAINIFYHKPRSKDRKQSHKH